jgi:hypothetical protein
MSFSKLRVAVALEVEVEGWVAGAAAPRRTVPMRAARPARIAAAIANWRGGLSILWYYAVRGGVFALRRARRKRGGLHSGNGIG